MYGPVTRGSGESAGEFAGAQNPGAHVAQRPGSGVGGSVRLGRATFLPGRGLGTGTRDKGTNPGS